MAEQLLTDGVLNKYVRMYDEYTLSITYDSLKVTDLSLYSSWSSGEGTIPIWGQEQDGGPNDR